MIKEQLAILVDDTGEKRADTLSATLVPTPTAEYRLLRKLTRAATASAAPPSPNPLPIPLPVLNGPRVLIWKQDPSVSEIGVRKTYINTLVSSGPHDARITITGMATVSPNALGDFIQVPGTPEFDAVHTFAVVRKTLTMYQRAFAVGNVPAALPWQWNTAPNTTPISVAPRHSNMMNAFYMRSSKLLAFGFFPKPGTPVPQPIIYTCRSLDIVSHECGHAILDGLKPQWLTSGATPQTGALHEAFGDLTAIFLALSQLDQVEAIVAQTKSNLHDKTFLADMAEEFGLALGRPNGLRNADNDLKLSEVGTEVHSLSQVFTGAIYDVLADIFAFERKAVVDDAVTLHQRAAYLLSLLLRGIMQAPASNATFTDVANKMLTTATADAVSGRLTAAQATAYRNFIRNRFNLREITLTAPLEGMSLARELRRDVAPGEQLEANAHISTDPSAPQDRGGCCGTMTLPENNGVDEAIEKEQQEFLNEIVALANEASQAPRPTQPGHTAHNGHAKPKPKTR
jgi:hypothetical protein